MHVIHASDGSFPSDMATGDAEALAEERRLFYVAVTRARDVLEVNVPVRYHHHRHRLDDRHSYAQLSRFLSPAVQALTDTTHTGGAGGGTELPGGGTGPAPGVEAVDALLAELWVVAGHCPIRPSARNRSSLLPGAPITPDRTRLAVPGGRKVGPCLLGVAPSQVFWR